MKKKVVHDLLIIIVTLIIAAGINVGARLIYKAEDIEFNPNDTTWNVNNVSDALSDIKYNYISKSKLFWNFDFVGASYQTFDPPIEGNYKIELWGASGGTKLTETPGKGAYTSGIIHLAKQEKLYVFVGEVGDINSSNYNSFAFNGGGYTHANSSIYSRGGGATDVRLNVSSNAADWNTRSLLTSRIMVAGGGGGPGSTWTGGDAGGLKSYKGSGSAPTGKIATQTSGYLFGSGGPGLNGLCYSGSGGGYYGGDSAQGANYDITAGGSSYISGHTGCVAVTSSSNLSTRKGTNNAECKDDTTDNLCSVHYSNKVFTNTVMIDGKGCVWDTDVTTKCDGMPKHDGTGTMTGNIGNGYARITLISVD